MGALLCGLAAQEMNGAEGMHRRRPRVDAKPARRRSRGDAAGEGSQLDHPSNGTNGVENGVCSCPREIFHPTTTISEKKNTRK
jgi:hypothetical protein